MAEVNRMTVRVEYDYGYVEEYTDAEWADIERWRAAIHERIWGRMWAALQQPPTPLDVPAALAGPQHPTRARQG